MIFFAKYFECSLKIEIVTFNLEIDFKDRHGILKYIFFYSNRKRRTSSGNESDKNYTYGPHHNCNTSGCRVDENGEVLDEECAARVLISLSVSPYTTGQNPLPLHVQQTYGQYFIIIFFFFFFFFFLRKMAKSFIDAQYRNLLGRG